MSKRNIPPGAVRAQFVTPSGKNVKTESPASDRKVPPTGASAGPDKAAGSNAVKQSPSESSQRGSRFSNTPADNRGPRESGARQTVGEMKKSFSRAAAQDHEDNPDHDQNVDQSDTTGLHVEKKFSGRCRLFVGNLPNDMTEYEFRKLFEPFGELNEVFLNSGRGFGFIRLDTRHHSEDARAAVDGRMIRGRPVRVRFAAHSAALRVRYLSLHVSNEMLYDAFSMFGELERAVVVVDDRGKPTGEGIVEFARKPGAMTALKRVNEGVFLMTSNPRPIGVELLEQTDENDGLPEVFVTKTPDVLKEREQQPRFAQPGSFEYEFGLKWKTLYQMLQEQQDLLKRNFEEEVSKMELDMDAALMEQHTALLRQDLMRRQEELHRLEEQTQMEIQRRLEARRHQDDERRRQNMEIVELRHREEMWRQQQKKKHDEELYGPGPAMDRPMGFDRPGVQQPPGDRPPMPAGMILRPERAQGPPGPMMHRPERGLAPPMQPPPVPPTGLGMERPRMPGPGGPAPGPGNQGPMAAGGPPNGEKNIPGLMMQQQQRPRFEHPQQGMVGPGANMGKENPRMAAPPGHDEFFDAKRMRRF